MNKIIFTIRFKKLKKFIRLFFFRLKCACKVLTKKNFHLIALTKTNSDAGYIENYDYKLFNRSGQEAVGQLSLSLTEDKMNLEKSMNKVTMEANQILNNAE